MAHDYVQTVAQMIIAQLKAGTAPWLKPWQPGERFLPYNPTTGNAYQGMNAVWLMAAGEARGYPDCRWLTYHQAAGEGAQVRRGEKGTLVQYWKWQGLEAMHDANGQPVLDENGRQLQQRVNYERPRVMSAVVFNAAQIDGLPPPPERLARSEWARHAEAEQLLTAGGAQIRHEAGDRACYRLATDLIVLPERSQFATSDAFYATALHEKGHWSGHPSRLDRDLAHPFGSEGYAREELRAEIASMMLGEQLEIGHDPGAHVAYIGSWIQALENDPREIFRAAAAAQKIVSYLRGLAQPLAEELPGPFAPERAGRAEEKPLPVQAHSPESSMTTDDRVYLAVPYREKDDAKAAAKAAGFRIAFDREAKAWWAPAGADLTLLQRWRAAPPPGGIDASPAAPHEEFAQALHDAGLLLDGLPDMDGQLRRVRVAGDAHGERSGAYVGFADGHPAGYIQNFKTGLEHNWKSSRRSAGLGEADLARLNAEAAQRREAREAAREALFEQTVAALAAHLAEARPATADHPYLQRKGVDASPGLYVDPQGLRLGTPGAEDLPPFSARGNLLVPVHDLNGRLLGAQSIDGEGRKSFPRGGRVQGGHFMIGDPQASPAILIVEGYATGRTVHDATAGLAVAVAFNSGNLSAVAQRMRAHFPDKPLYIAGDNDHQKARELGPNGQPKPNVGQEKAQEAAQCSGGQLLLPRFRPEDAGSDWNDLAQLHGQEAVREQLRAGLALGARRQMTGGRSSARPDPVEPVTTRARRR
jgi:putative DNA primase/helicase